MTSHSDTIALAECRTPKGIEMFQRPVDDQTCDGGDEDRSGRAVG